MLNEYLEYDLFIPFTNEQGQEYPSDDINEIKRRLIDFFGGLTETSFSNEGLWKIGPLVVRDKIRIWRVLSDREEKGDQFLTELREELEKKLHQDSVLIVRRTVVKI